MMRRARTRCFSCVLICAVLTGMLTGCWDYRGLDEFALVAGVAVDIEPESGLYQLTFEIIDLSTPTETKGITSFMLTSTGETIFDAARNAKTRIENKLYFGDTLLVVVSREIAAQRGIFPVVDWFLRDNETRENVNLVISRMETAAEILNAKLREGSVVSFEILEIASEDNKVTSSTNQSEIYEVYNILRSEGISLSVPAISTMENNGKVIPYVDGIYAFTGDKTTGYLSFADTKYFLFATDKVKGGILAIDSPFGEKKPAISLEIAENKTKHSFEEKDGALTVRIETETKVYLGEVQEPMNLLDQKVQEAIQTKAEESLKMEIQRVVGYIQKDLRTDILGLGNIMYRTKRKMWYEYGGGWADKFPDLNLEVVCKMEIVNSAHLKTTVKE